ncbi:MAG: hypothetical protein ACU0DI_00180 [Paracoccaceae bacterium]
MFRTSFYKKFACYGLRSIVLTFLIYSTVAVSNSTWLSSANAASAAAQVCNSTDGCMVQNSNLSSQDTDPFLFLGKLVDESHPRFGDYKRAIKRFSHVRQCYEPGDSSLTELDLLKFEWKKPKGRWQLEVCLFRIATSLGDSAALREWLDYHGFFVTEVARARSEKFKPRFENDPVYNISAVWSAGQYREILRPSILAKIIGFDFVRRFSIVFLLSDTKKVVGVSASPIME